MTTWARLVLHFGRNAVPHPARADRQIFQRPGAALQAAVMPVLEHPAGYAELAQRPPGRQMQRFAVVGDEDRPRVSSDKRVRPSHKSCAECPLAQISMLQSVCRSGHDHRACFAVRQGGGLAMTMREAYPQPLAPGATAMTACHVGRGSRFINEHEALGFEIDLAVEPALALPQDVGAVLLDRVHGLFLRVIP